MFCNLTFEGGQVTFDDLNLDPNVPLAQQTSDLKEDMLQVHYLAGKYLIDVGWYPSFSAHGAFRAIVVKDYNWEDPLYLETCRTLKELEHALLACKQVVAQAQERIR